MGIEYKIYKCLNCGEIGFNPEGVKYFKIPGNTGNIGFYNSYLLCKDHEHLNYKYTDLYDENGQIKEINHENVTKRYSGLVNLEVK